MMVSQVIDTEKPFCFGCFMPVDEVTHPHRRDIECITPEVQWDTNVLENIMNYEERWQLLTQYIQTRERVLASGLKVDRSTDLQHEVNGMWQEIHNVSLYIAEIELEADE